MRYIKSHPQFEYIQFDSQSTFYQLCVLLNSRSFSNSVYNKYFLHNPFQNNIDYPLSAMSLQHQIAEIRSLQPIRALCPTYSIRQRPWYKVYRAECMIPFAMYSIKIVYVITFIAYRIYVRVQLFLVPMVFPNAFPLQYEGYTHNISEQPKPIPLSFYAYNCIYCGRCNLGNSCKGNIPGSSDPEKYEKQNIMRMEQEQISEKKQQKIQEMGQI